MQLELYILSGASNKLTSILYVKCNFKIVGWQPKQIIYKYLAYIRSVNINEHVECLIIIVFLF